MPPANLHIREAQPDDAAALMVRLQLKVFTRNGIAIHLYEKLGFKTEGRHPNAFHKQGVWLEELTMGLILQQP